MSQRITAIFSGTAAAACVIVCVLLWQFVRETQRTQAATLASMQELQAQLLQRIPAGTAAEAPGQSAWGHVRLRLVTADSEKPVTDATAELRGGPFDMGEQQSIQLQESSTEDGAVDFGAVPHGQYTLQVACPTQGFQLEESLIVGPGRPEEVALRVPTPAADPVTRIEFNAPEPIHPEYKLILDYKLQPLVVDGRNWRWMGPADDVILNHQGVVERSAVLAHGGSSHHGRTLIYYDLQTLQELPPVPINVSSVSLLQPVEAPSAAAESNRSDVTTTTRAFALVAMHSPARQRSQIDVGAEFAEFDLPSSFWDYLSWAEIRAGRQPLPEGTQIVEISSPSNPESAFFWNGLDVILHFIPRDYIDWENRQSLPPTQTLQLLHGVDVFDVEPDPIGLSSSGDPTFWNYSLLVTEEQRALLDLARRTHNASFRFSRHAPNDLGGTPLISAEAVEWLESEAAPVSPPESENGAG